MAAQGVFVPQPKVGKNSCFVLHSGVTIDRGISTNNPQEERPTNEGAELRLIRLDG